MKYSGTQRGQTAKGVWVGETRDGRRETKGARPGFGAEVFDLRLCDDVAAAQRLYIPVKEKEGGWVGC